MKLFLLTMFTLTFGIMTIIGCQESGNNSESVCEVCQGSCPCTDGCDCEANCTCCA